MQKVTVVLPSYNEEKTIAKVIDIVQKTEGLHQIIVIDNNSNDNTYKIAKEKGAKVLFCKEQGKGHAMQMGVDNCETEIIVFLDSDVTSYEDDIVYKLSEPIRAGRADFVKSNFNRRQGRVTELTAKPLLKIFYPELAYLSQPLGGMVAVKTSLLRKMKLKNDYGVDIGILIDAYNQNAKIEEVYIGMVEHESQELIKLSKMALDVASTIIEKKGLI